VNRKTEFSVYVVSTFAVFGLVMIIASSLYGESFSTLLMIAFAAFLAPLFGIPVARALMKSRIGRSD